MQSKDKLDKFEKTRKIILDELKKGSLTFEELKQKTNLSRNCLNKQIGILIEYGCVGRELKDSFWGSPPFEYYFICGCFCYTN